MIDFIISQAWSLALSAGGLLGFWLSGEKVWWSWYVNLANQALWFTYAVVTDQYGFLLGAVFYTIVFARNARRWTREHFKEKDNAGGS